MSSNDDPPWPNFAHQPSQALCSQRCQFWRRKLSRAGSVFFFLPESERISPSPSPDGQLCCRRLGKVFFHFPPPGHQHPNLLVVNCKRMLHPTGLDSSWADQTWEARAVVLFIQEIVWRKHSEGGETLLGEWGKRKMFGRGVVVVVIEHIYYCSRSLYSWWIFISLIV